MPVQFSIYKFEPRVLPAKPKGRRTLNEMLIKNLPQNNYSGGYSTLNQIKYVDWQLQDETNESACGDSTGEA